MQLPTSKFKDVRLNLDGCFWFREKVLPFILCSFKTERKRWNGYSGLWKPCGGFVQPVDPQRHNARGGGGLLAGHALNRNALWEAKRIAAPSHHPPSSHHTQHTQLPG